MRKKKISFLKFKSMVTNMYSKGSLYNKELFFKEFCEYSSSWKLQWIIIRFSQLCGIFLTNDFIQSFQQNKISKIKRTHILDFINIIKCPPLLDFYTGKYYFKKEK